MADQTAPTGQFIPLSRYNEVSNAPSSYSTMPQGVNENQYQGQSFNDLFNRTQLTSSQLKSMQAPPTNGTSMYSTIPQGVQNPTITTGQAFTPTPGVNYSDKQFQETNNHLKHMPSNPPQGDELANQMLKNMQALKSVQTNQATKQFAPQQSLADVTRNTTPYVNPKSAQINPQQDIPTSAFSSALASNTAIPSTEPVITPIIHDMPAGVTPMIEPTINTAPKSNFPAYIPTDKVSQQIAAARQAAVTGQEALIQTQQLNQNTVNNQIASQQDVELLTDKPAKKKGFFSAMGSFFKNIASGVTLGLYRPDGEAAPQGIKRVTYPIKKLVWDTPKSIVYDAPVGIYNDISKSGKKSEPQEQTLRASHTLTLNDVEPTTTKTNKSSHGRRSLRRNFYT
jgi:hypothetical protein